MSVPRMEPKTPTKKNKRLKLKTPKRKNNVSLKKSSSTIDLNHVPITTMEKKWELKDYSRIMEPNLQKKYNKRRAAPGISQKELQKFFDNKQQLSPWLITQSGDLNIEESLTGIVSLLESDDLELLVKNIAHANGERGMVAMTKKKGRWQEKLEKLEHGELVHPWKLQLQNIVKEGDKHDEEHSQFWEKERELFLGRIDLFLIHMRDIQALRLFH
ncbi:hypothetical protein ACLB2K_050552 [Fragaria x ananassa]